MPLGAGDLDLPGVLGAPDARGFRGWLTVELDEYEGDPASAARVSADYLRDLTR